MTDAHSSTSEPGTRLNTRGGTETGASPAFPYWRAFAVFVGCLALLILITYRDWRPQPMYDEIDSSPVPDDQRDEGFFAGEPLEIRFIAEAKDVNGIYIPGLLYRERQTVSVHVENLTTGKTLADGFFPYGQNDIFHWRGGNAKGDEILVRLEWEHGDPPRLTDSATVFLWTGDPQTKARPPGVPAAWKVQAPAAGPLGYGEPVEVSWDAAAGGFNLIQLEGLEIPEDSQVRVEVFNEYSGQLLKKVVLNPGESPVRAFEAGNAEGERLKARFTWIPAPPPNLQQATFPPRYALSVSIGGKPTDFRPMFAVRHAWPTSRLHWLWLLMPVAIYGAWKQPRSEWLMVVLLGVCCTASSLMGWQQTYSHMAYHLDPDLFGEYGAKMADWVTGGQDREEFDFWIEGFRYSHIPLTPGLVALFILCGFPMVLGYVLVVTLASFGTLLVMRKILAESLGLSRLAVIGGLLMLAGDFVFLRAFAKPSTDQLGLLLVILFLWVLMDRLKRDARWHIVLLAAIAILSALARPPGITYVAFITGGAVLCDWIREGKMRFGKRVVTALMICIVPLGVLAFLYFDFGLGWRANLERAYASKTKVAYYMTSRKGIITMSTLLQWLPLLWLLAGRKLVKHPAAWISLLWLVYYIALIVAVQAALIHRLFLPVIPAMMILSALALHFIAARAPRTAWAIALIFTASNVAILWYTSMLPYLPPEPFSEFIY